MPNEPNSGHTGRTTSSAASDRARKRAFSPGSVVPSQPIPAGASAKAAPAKAVPAAATPTTSAKDRASLRSHLDAARTRLADLVWLVAVLAAIVLSIGALLVALGANADNVLVSAILDTGHAIDGPFWKVFEFYKENASGSRGAPDDVKNHLVNWGLAAVGYLVVGRVSDRLIRP